jgi:hypothetical protein
MRATQPTVVIARRNLIMKRPLRKALVAAACLAAAGWATANPVNLVVNGDFQSGFTGFGSDYRVSNSGCIGCVGVAATTTGWYNAPGYVFPFGDHTTGQGLMLQYDPPAAANGTARIWYQTVAVTQGETYEFSGWVREANSETSPNNGRVGVYADGALLGQQDAPDGDWIQWRFGYTASRSGNIELALRDLYPTTYFGTYSAIDDLRFEQTSGTVQPPTGVPEPGSAALAGLGLLLAGWANQRRRRG